MAALAVCTQGEEDILLLDSSVVRAHQHAAGAQGGQKAEALGRSRGGFSTKIHAATDTRGRPLRILVTGGQRHDVTAAPALVEGPNAGKVLADKAYDADTLLRLIEEQGGIAVIPSRSNRREPRALDTETYKSRNAIERFFCWLKRYRRIATRYEKRASSYSCMLSLAAALHWCRFS